VAEKIKAKGGRILTNTGARLAGGNGRIEAVYAGSERIEPSMVIWTAPITLACDQLSIERPDLPYLSTIFYNVMLEEEVQRKYQWCYYGADDIVFSRVSTPKYFADDTVPNPRAAGLCVEVTCREGDERWLHAERLTDWVVDDLIKVGMISSRRKVHDVRVERVANTYPIYHSRYPGELEKARKGLAQYENLQLAGRTGMFWYNNMDHSIENAMQLSRKLLRESGRAEIDEKLLAAGLAG
jgi:protoporphyrinogen oxidase